MKLYEENEALQEVVIPEIPMEDDSVKIIRELSENSPKESVEMTPEKRDKGDSIFSTLLCGAPLAIGAVLLLMAAFGTSSEGGMKVAKTVSDAVGAEGSTGSLAVGGFIFIFFGILFYWLTNNVKKD
ncbi:MAG: hypothetical protein MJ064_00575 [Lachnospiraceae bacterium]|nr:hypothetical protein [Lachnospiraceae bacterium]